MLALLVWYCNCLIHIVISIAFTVLCTKTKNKNKVFTDSNACKVKLIQKEGAICYLFFLSVMFPFSLICGNLFPEGNATDFIFRGKIFIMAVFELFSCLVFFREAVLILSTTSIKIPAKKYLKMLDNSTVVNMGTKIEQK